MSTEMGDVSDLIYRTVAKDLDRYFKKTPDDQRSIYAQKWLADADEGEVENPAYLIGAQEHRVIRRALELTVEDGMEQKWVDILRDAQNKVWIAKRNEIRNIKAQEQAELIAEISLASPVVAPERPAEEVARDPVLSADPQRELDERLEGELDGGVGVLPEEELTAEPESSHEEIAEPQEHLEPHQEIRASSSMIPGESVSYALGPPEVLDRKEPDDIARVPVPVVPDESLVDRIDGAPTDRDPNRAMESVIPHSEAVVREVEDASNEYDNTNDVDKAVSRLIKAQERSSRVVSALESSINSGSEVWVSQHKRAISSVLGLINRAIGLVKGFLRKVAGVESKAELESLKNRNSELELRVQGMKHSLGLAPDAVIPSSKQSASKSSIDKKADPKAYQRMLEEVWGPAKDRPLAPGAGVSGRIQQGVRHASKAVKREARDVVGAAKTSEVDVERSRQKKLEGDLDGLKEVAIEQASPAEQKRDLASRPADAPNVAQKVAEKGSPDEPEEESSPRGTPPSLS